MEDRIRIPDDVCDYVESVRKVSVKDQKLKEFVVLCDSLEKCIDVLLRERDRPRLNGDYSQFKREVVKMKNMAIVEAYDDGSVRWRF